MWLEMGMFFGARKRIVAAFYGVEKNDIATDELTPIMLKRIDSVYLNSVDTYFAELSNRVDVWRDNNA